MRPVLSLLYQLVPVFSPCSWAGYKNEANTNRRTPCFSPILHAHLPGTLGSHVDKAVVVCDIFSHVPYFIQPIRSEEVWNSVGSIVWKFPALIAR